MDVQALLLDRPECMRKFSARGVPQFSATFASFGGRAGLKHCIF